MICKKPFVSYSPCMTQMYEYDVDGEHFVVLDFSDRKVVKGKNYNSLFRKTDGFFARWGARSEDDPPFSPIGPEILDIEISVNGCPNGCRFCYKNNKATAPTNMSLDTFKRILAAMPKALTQIAFGITGVQTNPDFIPMMRHCRNQGIIPNFTLSGIDLTDAIAKECASLIGAVAVSAYQSDKTVCYDTVKKFTDLGIKQTNIHLMVSKETLPFVYEVLEDRQKDARLANMNAIVFLGLKPKGRARGEFHPISTDEYAKLIDYCFEHKLMIGFDSCSAPKFEMAVKASDMTDERKQSLIECSESCESSLFSAYINVNGQYCHCSFAEGEGQQIMLPVQDDFLKSVWYHPEVMAFRKKLIDNSVAGCRRCQIFPEINP